MNKLLHECSWEVKEAGRRASSKNDRENEEERVCVRKRENVA